MSWSGMWRVKGFAELGGEYDMFTVYVMLMRMVVEIGAVKCRE